MHPMSVKDVALESDPPTQDELKTLKKEWDEGRLDGISTHLLEFVERHRKEILAIAHDSYAPEELLAAVRAWVRQKGFIHLPLDMADQIRAFIKEHESELKKKE